MKSVYLIKNFLVWIIRPFFCASNRLLRFVRLKISCTPIIYRMHGNAVPLCFTLKIPLPPEVSQQEDTTVGINLQCIPDTVTGNPRAEHTVREANILCIASCSTFNFELLAFLWSLKGSSLQKDTINEIKSFPTLTVSWKSFRSELFSSAETGSKPTRICPPVVGEIPKKLFCDIWKHNVNQISNKRIFFNLVTVLSVYRWSLSTNLLLSPSSFLLQNTFLSDRHILFDGTQSRTKTEYVINHLSRMGIRIW